MFCEQLATCLLYRSFHVEIHKYLDFPFSLLKGNIICILFYNMLFSLNWLAVAPGCSFVHNSINTLHLIVNMSCYLSSSTSLRPSPEPEIY